MQLVIGNKKYSSWSLRGWLLARRAGVDFEEVLIPLYQPGSRAAVLAYSPSGLVPCLVDDDVVVWDSLAIAEYLNDRFDGARFYPEAAGDAAFCRSICAEIHAGFATLRHTCPMDLAAPREPKTPDAALTAELARLDAIGTALGERFGDAYLDAGDMDAVGAFMTPIATRYRTWGLAAAAPLRRYFDALLADPWFGEWQAAARAETLVVTAYENL